MTKSNGDDKCNAFDILRNGGVIAFPTDTLYGIATSIYSKEGYHRIYEIKESVKKTNILYGSFYSEGCLAWPPIDIF